jgi:hypothetical protein
LITQATVTREKTLILMFENVDVLMFSTCLMNNERTMATRRDVIQFIVSYVVICVGSGLFTFLFFRWFPFLGWLGISFLILGAIGIVDIRRRGVELKRTNPELFEKLRAESKKRAQERRAREVRFSDFPRWMLVLAIVVVVVGSADEFRLLRLNASLETVVGVLTLLFIVYYLYYEFKIIRKKRKASSPSLPQKQEL